MFIIEGNMGVGKSTFLSIIEKSLPNITIAYEPLDQWQHTINGDSIFTHFYKNAQRWGYSFELATLMARIRHYANLNQKYPHQLTLMERSLFSGYYCFAHNSHQQGFLNNGEWHAYQQWFDFLIKKAHCIPRGFIYLRSSPSVAYKRIQKRARKGEMAIPYEYILQIHERHEQFLIHKHNIMSSLQSIPILIIDCDKDFESDKLLQYVMKEKIQRFMQEHMIFHPASKPSCVHTHK